MAAEDIKMVKKFHFEHFYNHNYVGESNWYPWDDLLGHSSYI